MDILKKLLALWLLFIRPAAEAPGGDDTAGDGADTGGDDAGEGDDAGDGDDDQGDDTSGDGADTGGEKPPAGASARETQLQADNERYQREITELRAQHKPTGPAADKDIEEWTRIANDPKSTSAEKWYANSNIEIRTTKNFSQTALAQSLDISDKTAFAGVALSDPLAKKYEPRVEEELAKMRRNGQNANREAIYTFLLGKDMREGKFKKKAATTTRTTTGTTTTAVNRGRLPGARADVHGKNTMSDHEKRAKRLENVQI